jgi:hypothetical protein
MNDKIHSVVGTFSESNSTKFDNGFSTGSKKFKAWNLHIL